MLILILFLFGASLDLEAKENSSPITETLRCQNKMEVMIQGDSKNPQTFYKKDFTIPLKKVQIITLKDQKKIIGHVYPQWGIDHKIKDKKFTITSDKKNSFQISKNAIPLLSCELRDE